MKIISFAHTTPALVTFNKTVTRRKWTDGHAASFAAAAGAGAGGARPRLCVRAYDRLPRAHGQAVAVIELLAAPYRQRSADAPQSDYAAEGFMFMAEHGIEIDGRPAAALWADWHDPFGSASAAAADGRLEQALGSRPRSGGVAFARELWVVRFRVVELTERGRAIALQYMTPPELAAAEAANIAETAV